MSGVLPILDRLPHVVFVFGIVVFVNLSLNVGTAKALDADATAVEGVWCVEVTEGGVPPSCNYHDFLACAMAAVGAGGSCKAASSIQPNALNVSNYRPSASPQRGPKPASRRPERESPLSAVERETLFRKFVEWNRRRSIPTDIASQLGH